MKYQPPVQSQYGWLRRCWLRKTGMAPAPGWAYVPPTLRDSRVAMRRTQMLLMAGMLYLVVMMVSAFTGHFIHLPLYLLPAITVPLVLLVSGPGAMASGLLVMVRPRWTEQWEGTWAPAADYWRLLGSNLTPNEYEAYWRIPHGSTGEIDSTTSDWTAADDAYVWPKFVEDGRPTSMSVTLVAWLRANHVSPAQFHAYVMAGASPSIVDMIVLAGISPDETRRLIEASTRAIRGHRITPVLWLYEWAKKGQASVHPVTGEQVSHEEIVDVLIAWMGHRLVHLPAAFRACPHDPPAPGVLCLECSRTAKDHHGLVFPWATVQKTGPETLTVNEWTEIAGALAPYAVAAGLTPDEVRRMLAERPEDMTRETLQAFAALRDS